MNLCNLYEKRPFQVRNADEFDLEKVLDLFVDPTDGLTSPFTYENSIIKGQMGSGKTMYLRANYAYYLYTIIPSLLEECSIILPIYIKLSDFQTLRDCLKIYNNIIIKILEEMINIFQFFKSSEKLAKLHNGFKDLYIAPRSSELPILKVLDNIKQMSAEEYIETVNKTFDVKGSLGNNLFNVVTDYANSTMTEIKKNCQPKFTDIVDAYNSLFKPYDVKLLILFDEVGSINRSFFKETNENSYFESLMNQLRTLPFVRTKIAIYPNSQEDVLTETRYGDVVELECNVEDECFDIFLNRVIAIIEKYINKDEDTKFITEDLFAISTSNMDVLEHIVYASNGNMRRLVHLLDSCLNTAYKHNKGQTKVNIDDVFLTLREHAKKIENLFSPSEKELLGDIVSVCKSRNAYKFAFPNKSVSLIKYTNKSEEYNIINLIEQGTGRKSSIYQFDYSYCIYKEIPTHFIKNSEKIDKTRSRKTGERIKKVTKITNELIEQAVISGKIEGVITYLNTERTLGFVTANNIEYFFTKDSIVCCDKTQKLANGKTLRFIPINDQFAKEIEVL
ncbi:hypothetical protein RBG61_01485 [Paludicola sp. MB14-C6]|uniref:ORC-CDC6 family AAA ATPase n=1 Tax=Paludihabitans sp. MB14-C6 TaxID=3070656 RepID=UPI0027DD6736|nr:hypothetical protein [Paludicola sp. MB14-C6]WMJ23362.1 hypothetical protein RBG61_01485 [Paludicola sp. MB14-C6]